MDSQLQLQRSDPGSVKGCMSRFRCLLRVSHLWKGRRGKKGDIVQTTTVLPDKIMSYLPVDIIGNILCRLPAEFVFSCTSAHKPLLALKTSRAFIEMHMSRSTPVIVFHHYELNTRKQYWGENIENYFFDEMARTLTPKRIKIELGPSQKKRKCVAYVYGSCDGFLLIRNLWRDCVVVIWNPITQEQVTVVAPSTKYQVCGFYFHNASKEYRVLFVSTEDECFHYFILSLSTKSTRRVGSYSHLPSRDVAPVLLNGVLHWTVCDELYKKVHGVGPDCLNAILLFDINSEIFSTMQHPGGPCLEKNKLRNKHVAIKLMDLKGLLCMCDHTSYFKIVVWVLRDYEKKNWVTRHTIFYPITFDDFRLHIEKDMKVKVLHIFEDEVLLLVVSKFLFLYNMQSQVVRVVRKFYVREFIAMATECQYTHTSMQGVCHFNTLASIHTDKFVHLYPEETPV